MLMSAETMIQSSLEITSLILSMVMEQSSSRTKVPQLSLLAWRLHTSQPIKCTFGGIVSYDSTDSIIFSNMILIDNGWGAAALIG